MSTLAESWDPIAHTLGYADEKTMLLDLYEVQGYSLEELATRLGYARVNVRRRLLLCGATLRGRGGKNNSNNGRLAIVTDDELTRPKEVAEKFGVHLSTVFKEKRRRDLCISVPLPPNLSSESSPAPEIITSPSLSGSKPITTIESITPTEPDGEISSS